VLHEYYYCVKMAVTETAQARRGHEAKVWELIWSGEIKFFTKGRKEIQPAYYDHL
jgi:hypothetical protein